MLTPNSELKALQDKGDFTELLVRSEELKGYPFGAVWDEYCERCGVKTGMAWYSDVVEYDREVLSLRK
jgi:L-rhamnose isomerase